MADDKSVASRANTLYKFGRNSSICLSVAVVYVSLFGYSRALEHVP